jgi:DNA-binding XRE family transcriptional regulator
VKDYAERPLELGEHIKRKRRLAGLTQSQAGLLLNVGAYTVMNWEKAKTDPPITCLPAIVAFLGYDPSPKPESLMERMRHYRRVHGLSIKVAARRLGVHEDSWGQWERTGVIAWQRYRLLMEEFLAATAVS